MLLCGLAFSGKSTLARILAARLGGAVVSLDEINARRGLWGGEGVAAEEWARTHETALGEIDALLRKGVSPVIVDDTNCFRFLRDSYRRLGRRHGCREMLVVLDTPLATIHRRREEARRRRHRPPIRDEVWEAHRRSFEWPGDDEPHRTLPAGADVETWVRRYLQPLLQPLLRPSGKPSPRPSPPSSG